MTRRSERTPLGDVQRYAGAEWEFRFGEASKTVGRSSHGMESLGVPSALARADGRCILDDMVRTDSASLIVHEDPARIFAAMVDRNALERWLPPEGMTGHFEHFDARPGGWYRLILSYDAHGRSRGKSTPDSDVVEVRFVEVRPDERLVQEVDFVSDDPDFQGTMTLTWELHDAGDAIRVEIRADGVPSGISREDHAEGLASSLANLAAYLRDQS